MIIDPENLTLKAIIKHIRPAGKSVLEVGCGDGRLSSQLSCHAGRLTAVDPDREALAKARRSAENATFALVSGENLAFAAHSFDAVVFTLSLHHQDSTAALQEAARVVRPDGIILVVEPCPDGEVALLCNLFNDETEVLNRALHAVRSCGLSPGLRETLTPLWKCADDKALIDWLFDHFNAPYDRAKADAIADFLGRRPHSRPLVLQDKLAVISLHR